MLKRLSVFLAALALVPASASAAGWLATSPVPISNTPSYYSEIGIADSGRGAMTWLEHGATNDTLMVATYEHGAGASGVVALSTQNASGPDLAVSPKGDAIVAWREAGFGTPTIRAATRGPSAGSFTPATGIVTAGSVETPVAAALGDGTLVVAWVDATAAKVAVRHPGDASFTTTTLGKLGSVQEVALAAAPGGGAALAITDLVQGESRLMLSLAPSGGSFADPSEVVGVDTSGGDELKSPGLSYGPGGKLGLGIVKTSGGSDEVYALTRDAGGTIGFPTPIPNSTWSHDMGVAVSFASDGSEAITYSAVQSGPAAGKLAVASPSGAWNAVPVWPASVIAGSAQVATIGPRFVALGGSYGDGLAGGLVPNLASLGTVTPGAPGSPADFVDSIAAHGDDAVATVTHQVDGAFHVETVAWDGTRPVISDLSAPAAPVSGTTATFHATVSDALSPASVAWDFGDGSTGNGADATHAFANPGTFTVTVRATDGAGNTSTRSANLSVAAAPPPGATTLRFLSAKLNHRHTRVKWSLSLPASVSAAIKRGKRTVSTTRHPAAATGSARLVRAHGHKLRRGHYRIVLRARDGAGHATARTLKLRVR